MKRALKKIGKVVWRIAEALIIVLLVLLAEPKWFLNTKTLTWALKTAGKSYRPSWKSLSLEVRNANLLTKRVLFKADDLCLDAQDGEIKGCLPLVDADVFVHFGVSPVFSIRRVARLVVHSSTLTINQTAAPPAPKKKKPAAMSLQLLPAPVRRMTLGLLDVDIPRAVVVAASATTTASLTAGYSDQTDAPLRADAYVVIVGTAPDVVSHYRADLTLASDLWRLGTVSSLDLTARLRGDAGLRADVSATARQSQKDVLEVSARASASASGRLIRADLAAQLSAQKDAARAAVSLTSPTSAVRQVALRDCRFEAPLTKGQPRSADLSCALVLSPAPFGQPRGAAPKNISGTVAFHADFPRRWPHKDRFTAALKADIAAQRQWHAFFAHFAAQLAGRTGQLPASLTARHSLDAGFTVEDFQQLVSYLQDTDLAVPAPLDVLRGPVNFEARTAGDSRGETQRVDYRVSTELASQRQRLDVGVNGHVEVAGLFLPKKTITDVTEVDLRKIVVQLPRIKIGAMPQVAVDKRIETGTPASDAAAEAQLPGAQKSTQTAVDFTARVYTSTPILILCNLVGAPVPITLDVTATPAGLAGKIRIDSFTMDVFKQKGRVDHITLTPRPGSSAMGLDGKITVKREDVTVEILLLGSTDKPTVVFQSNPPLTENQIVSLLLFGQPPEALSSDQQASAGNATAAFASGALGLTSLYLFASTPIDSVGYDPTTGTYQVRFKLPGGATLTVGSNFQQSQTLGLRKRIAKNLELETELQTQQQGGRENAVTTFLEWFRRF